MASNDYSSQMKISDLHGWFVYVVYEINGPFTKIGTAANVKYRLTSLRNGNPRVLKLYKSWRVSSRQHAFSIERGALARAASKRIPGRDWVSLSHAVAAKLVEAAALEGDILLEEVSL